jgi:glycosyltransferase involved in cell wall biosynthesis
MRILQVIESLEFGGAEKVVVDLANELATRHEVTICCVKRLGDLARDVDSRIRVLCLDKAEGNDYRVPFRLARIAAAAGADVLHTHEWGVFLEGALAGALARTPVLVHTVHGPYTAYPPGWRSRLKRSLRHAIERRAIRRFARLVTVSDSIQTGIRDEIGIDSRRMTTIHNGIRVGSAARPASEGRSHGVTFIAVGRLARIKNHELMIRAFRALGDARSRLLLVGDGPERAVLEALARELGLESRMQFLGFRRDVADLLAASDAFLVSSDHEGVSIAVLEAMRAGLPVIGTRVGGMAETVKDGRTGLLVTQGDVDSMARAMRLLVESPEERKRLGSEGRRYLESEFSIENMVSRYERVYRGA